MPSIVDAADSLLAADLPVIFLDTCILLDVIRAIKRKYKNCVATARHLHTIATVVPPQCSVVISHIVRHEWGVCELEVLTEATRHLVEIEEQSVHFHEACNVLGITTGFGRANYAGHNMAVRLRNLSCQLIECGMVIDPDQTCSDRAMTRVIHNVPPSTRGAEAKDCNIIEQYFAVCQRMHDAGFGKKLVFCTFNTNDYCGEAGLHGALAAEFAAVGLRFSTNLPWGVYDVMH